MAALSITWADVVALPGGASLASVSPATQTVVLAQVLREFDHPGWGDRAAWAAANLAAHIATLGLRAGGGVGPLITATVGQVSATFAVPPWRSALSSTVFGVEYERVRDSIAAFVLPVLGGWPC